MNNNEYSLYVIEDMTRRLEKFRGDTPKDEVLAIMERISKAAIRLRRLAETFDCEGE